MYSTRSLLSFGFASRKNSDLPFSNGSTIACHAPFRLTVVRAEIFVISVEGAGVADAHPANKRKRTSRFIDETSKVLMVVMKLLWRQ